MEDSHQTWKAAAVNPLTPDRPKVSFYILAYNHQTMIREAIDGALNQTYQPLEIIISDDCSKDNTWQVIQDAVSDYQGPHSIVARRNERNLGISQHINEVWKHCQGDWIVASAGDDISKPDRVERIMEAVVARPEIKLVQSWIDEVDAEGNWIEVNRLGCDCNPGELKIYGLKERIAGTSYHAHGAAMAYSREVVDRFSPLPQGMIFEDNVVNLRAELLGSAAILALPLVKHRNHEGQITQSTMGQPPTRQMERLRARLESDIRSTEQNLRDVELLGSRIPQQIKEQMLLSLDRRLRYFHDKRNCILLPWPSRLRYLPAAIINRNVAPLSLDDLFHSLLPTVIYRWIKRIRHRLAKSRSID